MTLLGNYIKSVHQGDLRQRDEIRQLTDGQGKEYLHAGRVMAAYEKWFGPSPQRDILYILGLFDRPVEPGAIAALRKAPAIPGVTGRLQNLSEKEWQWALSHLREAGLVVGTEAHKNAAATLDTGTTGTKRPIRPIGPIETTGSIDSHPLVREYFGAKLKQENPVGWRAAHERLYRYYKDLPEKELKKLLAVKLYEKGILGIGKAKELIGVTRMEFLYLLKDEGVPLNYDQDDLENDLKTIEGI